MAQNTMLLRNGSSTGDWEEWLGGEGCFVVGGDFTGGGSVSLEIWPNGFPEANAVDGGSSLTFSANGAASFTMIPPCKVRAKVTGTIAGVYAMVGTGEQD